MAFDFFLNFATKNLFKSNLSMSERQRDIAHTRYDDGQWTNQSIEEHCLGVAALASDFAAEFHAAGWGKLCGWWHDIGKYALDFQHHILAASGQDVTIKDPGQVTHAVAGAVYAKEQLFQGGMYLPVAYCICGHHAGLHDYRSSGEANLEHHLTEVHVLDGIRELLGTTQIPLLEQPNIDREALHPMAWHLWIRMLYSCLVDADSLDTEKFMEEEDYEQRGKFASMAELKLRLDIFLQQFKSKESTSINQIRNNIQSLCRESGKGSRGIYTLTVPTGGGKTLSSMVWAMEHAKANKCQRIVIAIPYTSIVIQTANILKSIFGEDNVIEHHSSVDVDEEKNVKWKLATENWDAPIIVTTNVQLFESLYANKRSRCRKLHNIVNSILILDEVQMLPAVNLQPIVDVLRLLQRYFGVSILMTTATQPALSGIIGTGMAKFQGLESTEIVTDKMRLFEQLRRVDISFVKEKYTYNSLAEEICKYERVLCVVNTRRDAKMLFEAVHVKSNVPVVHLSKMMCQQHIMDKLDEVRLKLDHGEPIIVVSTQLIEAGVDIDFPVVYRAMAGLDSIAQAAGRCNREGRLERGQVVVFDFENARLRGQVRKAAEAADDMLQQGMDDFLSPCVTEAYFRDYYSKLDTTDEAKIAELLYVPTPNFATAARNFLLIKESNMTVFVPYGNQGKRYMEQLQHDGPSSWLFRKLQRYSVSISLWQKEQIVALGAVEMGNDIYYLSDTTGYSKETGLFYDNPYLDDTIIL